MNYSQKTLLASLLLTLVPTLSWTQQATPVDAAANVASTILRIQNIPTCICSLPTSDFLWAGGFSLVGAAVGHICTAAIVQLLDPEMKPVPRLFQPQKWTASQWVGTLGGAFIGGAGRLYVATPAFLAQRIDQSLLATLIETKPHDLKNSLDRIYVSERFPRAAAFKDLENLRTTLACIVESFTKLKGKKSYAEAKALTPTIIFYVTTVKDAMLEIKNDPRWLDECNASTLAMTQTNIEGMQNAQLAGTIIQLAQQ